MEANKGQAFPVTVIAILLAILVLVAIPVFRGSGGGGAAQPPELKTPYVAVLLNNNLAYFGRVESMSPRWLVLTDCYYIQTQVPNGANQGKTASNVLVKRGKELHAPDRMEINYDHIVFIEPVGTNSAVARLIDQSKRQSQ